MSGWFAVKHGICDHPAFDGDMAKVGFFIWMLDNAAFQNTTIDICGAPFVVKRGRIVHSQRFLASKAKMSVKALRTFLKTLESYGVVKIEAIQTGRARETRRTQVTFCNYEKYQTPGNNKETTGKQPGNREEQGNNIPVGKSADAPSLDPVKLMFDSGVALLMRGGSTEPHARSMLGKWRKDHGTEAVLAAIGKTEREGAIDPLEFITGIFRHQRKTGQIERPGYTHGGAFGMIPERN